MQGINFLPSCRTIDIGLVRSFETYYAIGHANSARRIRPMQLAGGGGQRWHVDCMQMQFPPQAPVKRGEILDGIFPVAIIFARSKLTFSLCRYLQIYIAESAKLSRYLCPTLNLQFRLKFLSHCQSDTLTNLITRIINDPMDYTTKRIATRGRNMIPNERVVRSTVGLTVLTVTSHNITLLGNT